MAGSLGVVAIPTAVFAGDLVLHQPKFPWSHGGLLDTIDHSRLVAFSL